MKISVYMGEFERSVFVEKTEPKICIGEADEKSR